MPDRARILVAMAFAACAVLLMSDPAHSQDPPLRALDVDVSRHPTVSMTFELPDSAVDDWSATVFEDGVARPTRLVSTARDGIEVMLVIDTSGSMAGAPIEAARSAALGFVRDLPPGARVGVVAFGSKTSVRSGLTGDRDVLAAAIGSLAAGGETALYDALTLATAELSDRDVPKAVILVSDGGDTASTATLDEAAAGLVASGARLYGLRLVTDDSNDGVIDAIAATTGGRASDAVDAASLAATYDEVAAGAMRQVRLSYDSGRTGDVRVRVDLVSGQARYSRELVLTLPVAPIPGGSASEPSGGDDPPRSATPVILGGGSLFIGLALLAQRLLTPHHRSLLSGNRPERRRGMQELKRRFGAAFDQTLERKGRREVLGARLEQAGIALRPGEYVLAAASAVALAAFVGLLVGGPAMVLVMASLAVGTAWLLLRMRVTRRRAALEQQLPDLLQQLTSSLRAGYGIMQALRAVAEEVPAPMSDELRRVVNEVQLGRGLVESLELMAGRVGGQDFAWVAQAVEINHEVGGDLVEVLESVAETIRARARLRRQIKTLSAQGRLSARILLSMPPVMALVLSVIYPGWLAPLTTGAGPAVLVVGAVLMALGSMWMKKIVRLEY